MVVVLIRGEVPPISLQIMVLHAFCFSCADGCAALPGARSTGGGVYTDFFYIFCGFRICIFSTKKVRVVCRDFSVEDSVRFVTDFVFFVCVVEESAWVSRILSDLTVLGESNRSSSQGRSESKLKIIG